MTKFEEPRVAQAERTLDHVTGRQPNGHPETAANDVDIIDIREHGQSLSLVPSIRAGLKEVNATGHRSLPSLLLWDEQGLKYFEDITYSPQYYLTNTEIDLLEAHSNQIAKGIRPGTLLLELGSGCLRKIEILLNAIDAFGTAVHYYALDLDGNELARTLHQLDPTRFHHVRCHGLLGTYDDGRAWLSAPENLKRPKTVLSLGSTIGSFTHDEAAEFWSEWVNTLKRKGDSVHQDDSASDEADAQIIIGLDACKDEERVFGAYNDKEGLNKRFILNALSHANKQLGYEAFNPADWTVKGKWEADQGRHGQFLVPTKDVVAEGVHLSEGEEVFIVYSHKYGEAEKSQLWAASGLKETRRFMTDDQTYGLHVLSPEQASD